MKSLACALVSFPIIWCRADAATKTPRFLGRPYGQAPRAIRIDGQKGDALEQEITTQNFKELTIAQGSGFDGFDAVRVFSDGSGYGVFSRGRSRNKKALITLSARDLSGLIAALNADRITRIKGLYSAGWHDGTQGFVEIKTKKGRRYCWLDNHFDPVSNTFSYCNKVIWPKIVTAKIGQKGVDPQTEYFRVFHSEQQNNSVQPPRADARS